ncbi:DUF3006 domain-containing protein [Deinococcus multiflagellatus]|uniref:DUF3006 domain-containing protein n=1 Tax=Deinococcus multiflagellatus TaxID=1656887 RepID=A0ABW1ZR96_9DEIO|nr:DUF3006 domain-containing protein [Deinococcus multiflagellatus]MBZ9715946.1 DUF3006 domain-containing protein [Deinococcus multiflagellatus]
MPDEPLEPVLTGTLIVDAIEGRFARVERENGATEDWPLASLPCGVREGDLVRVTVDGGDLEMEIDHEATRARRAQAQQDLDTLNAASPDGALDL